VYTLPSLTLQAPREPQHLSHPARSNAAQLPIQGFKLASLPFRMSSMLRPELCHGPGLLLSGANGEHTSPPAAALGRYITPVKLYVVGRHCMQQLASAHGVWMS
jgi:hypothetical protein